MDSHFVIISGKNPVPTPVVLLLLTFVIIKYRQNVIFLLICSQSKFVDDDDNAGKELNATSGTQFAMLPLVYCWFSVSRHSK